jgi:hypothetical protein
VRALVAQRVEAVLDRADAADARADHDAAALAVLVLEIDARLGDRLVGGAHPEERRAIELLASRCSR